MPRELNLKERHGVVQSLWTAVNEGGGWLKDVPHHVRTVIETRAWEEREVDGKVVKHERFVDFITTDPRAGCGWPPEKVEALIKDQPEVLAMWQGAIKGQHGGDRTSASSKADIIHLANPGGTSKRVLVERLQRRRPDLYDRVCAGELSANKAAIEAGFRKKPTPFEQVRKLIPKLTATEREQLLELLK